MRLLIVEDERAIAEVMMLNLKRVGYECEYAQDGEMGAAIDSEGGLSPGYGGV